MKKVNNKTSLDRLKKLGNNAENISMCIIDGDIDHNHPLLREQKINKLNIIKQTNSLSTNHGTAVCSQISGSGLGIAKNINLSSIAIFKEDDNGDIQGCSEITLTKALERALNSNVDIINVSAAALSVNGRGSDGIRRIIQRCEQKGILVVAAVGNEGRRCESIPASLPTVLAVGACDENGHPCAFNNHGRALRKKMLLAPGVFMPAALKNEQLALVHGSSFAAPIVSAIAALVKSTLKQCQEPCDAKDIREWLTNTATIEPLYEGSKENYSRLNINALTQKLSELVTNTTRPNKRKLIMSQTNDLTSNSDPVLEPQTVIDENAPFQPAELNLSELDVNPQAIETEQQGLLLPTVEDPAANRPVHQNSVSPQQFQAQHVSDADKVFLIGTLGYDFGREARLDYFTQVMGGQNAHPFDPVQMAKHLASGDNAEQSNALVWTLKIDGIPVYAIEPDSQFAVLQYSRLVEFLKDQEVNGVERISVAGVITGETRLMNGHVVPTVSPVLRGMFNWKSKAIAEIVMGDNTTGFDAESNKAKQDMLIDFLHRIYYELRNRGSESQERAINYAATNAHQMKEIFDEAFAEKLFLNKISAEESPVSRPDSDCWDVVLEFFNPKERLTSARKLYRYTVDVSDVMPVTIGKLRSWYAY